MGTDYRSMWKELGRDLEAHDALAAESRAHGAIHYSLQFCHPYLMESIPVEKALEAEVKKGDRPIFYEQR